MPAFRPGRPVFLFSLFLVAGCGPGKLNETRTLVFDGDIQAHALDLPAQSKPQQITVEFTSTDSVSVYQFKQEDAKTNDDLTTANPAKALASKRDSKGDTFSVEVPANTATRVVVRSGGRKAEVKITVTNQK